jgi:putative endonuclease
MSCNVYIIVCKDGSFYTGITKNLDSRMRLHTKGKGARYTRIHRPNKIVYVETLESRAEAMRREKAIKKMTHNQKTELMKSQKNQNRRRRQHAR